MLTFKRATILAWFWVASGPCRVSHFLSTDCRFPNDFFGGFEYLICSSSFSLLAHPIALRCKFPLLPWAVFSCFSFAHFPLTMTPSPSEAVAKVAQAASGTDSSAKVYKRESNTARVLGAGTHRSIYNWGIRSNGCRMCGNCRAHGVPPSRHHGEAIDEQHWQGAIQCHHMYDGHV